MLGRAGLIWFAIMVAAIFNGAMRDVLLVPQWGDPVARGVSSIALATLVLLITWVSLPWIKPASMADSWRIGAMWLAMTLAFEFGAGHYLFETPWPALFADYNVLAGRLWILVLIATLTSPALVHLTVWNHVRDAEVL